MEQEEEDICEVVIYADLGRRSRLLTGAGYLRGMHINWRVPLRGLQFRGVISGGLSPVFVAPATLLAGFFPII